MSPPASARSVRLFLPDGNPAGLMIAEVVNWTGKVLCAPRHRLADLLERREAARTGVYLLTGPDPDRFGGTIAYIGEADSVGTRLRRHDADDAMDFFDRAAMIVSNDDNLTKAHARFLEGRLIRRAIDAANVKIINATAPDFARLPEADLADMASFLDQLTLVLSIMGFDILRITQTAPSQMSANDPLFVLETMGASARARETDDAFIVLAGSTARKEVSPALQPSYRLQREQLVRDRKLVDDVNPESYRFAVDVGFSSPSTAAAVILGRSASGPREWKLAGSGQTYKDWRTAKLKE
jgi:hypothetical protein